MERIILSDSSGAARPGRISLILPNESRGRHWCQADRRSCSLGDVVGVLVQKFRSAASATQKDAGPRQPPSLPRWSFIDLAARGTTGVYIAYLLTDRTKTRIEHVPSSPDRELLETPSRRPHSTFTRSPLYYRSRPAVSPTYVPETHKAGQICRESLQAS